MDLIPLIVGIGGILVGAIAAILVWNSILTAKKRSGKRASKRKARR